MIDSETRAVGAYLYLHLGDQMPPVHPDPDKDDEIIELWSLTPDPPKMDLVRVRRFLDDLDDLLVDLPSIEPENYMARFYEAAKKTFDHDKSQIRTWFMWLYLIVFQMPEGPRWGEFVEIYGPDNFTTKVKARLFDITAKEKYR